MGISNFLLGIELTWLPIVTFFLIIIVTGLVGFVHGWKSALWFAGFDLIALVIGLFALGPIWKAIVNRLSFNVGDYFDLKLFLKDPGIMRYILPILYLGWFIIFKIIAAFGYIFVRKHLKKTIFAEKKQLSDEKAVARSDKANARKESKKAKEHNKEAEKLDKPSHTQEVVLFQAALKQDQGKIASGEAVSATSASAPAKKPHFHLSVREQLFASRIFGAGIATIAGIPMLAVATNATVALSKPSSFNAFNDGLLRGSTLNSGRGLNQILVVTQHLLDALSNNWIDSVAKLFEGTDPTQDLGLLDNITKNWSKMQDIFNSSVAIQILTSLLNAMSLKIDDATSQKINADIDMLPESLIVILFQNIRFNINPAMEKIMNDFFINKFRMTQANADKVLRMYFNVVQSV